MSESLRIMIVAGEPSGDAHAAALVNALREESPIADLKFFGATGPLMRAAGVESIVDTDQLAIFGIVEVGRVLPTFWQIFRQLKQTATNRNPDAIVLVDWPEFNLRLAKSLHRRSRMPIIYYISPQVWAWRSYRVNQIRRDVDLLLSILPFEKEWFAKRGMNQVEYVGHPLAGEVRSSCTREEFRLRHSLDSEKPIIALLPGSRHKELVRILPPMLEAAVLIGAKRSDVQFVLVVAPSRSVEEAKRIVDQHTAPTTFHMVHHETREALAAADVAAVASGTATLEAALLLTPMVIVYKESAINWNTLGRLITAEHYGLVNLIAQKRIVTELMQDDLNGKQLASELLSLLEPIRNAEMRQRLAEITSRLGDGGASRRAARAVLATVRKAKLQ